MDLPSCKDTQIGYYTRVGLRRDVRIAHVRELYSKLRLFGDHILEKEKSIRSPSDKKKRPIKEDEEEKRKHTFEILERCPDLRDLLFDITEETVVRKTAITQLVTMFSCVYSDLENGLKNTGICCQNFEVGVKEMNLDGLYDELVQGLEEAKTNKIYEEEITEESMI